MDRSSWLVLLACLATAWGGLRPGDVDAAPQAWEAAEADKGDDRAAMVWVGVAAFQRDVAPWQPGYALARQRLAIVSRDRRAALSHDRGGTRGERSARR